MIERAGQVVAWVWRTRLGKLLAFCLLLAGVITTFGEAVDAWPKVAGFPYRPALLVDVNEYRPVVNELLQWKLEDFIARQDERSSELQAESTKIQTQLPKEQDAETVILLNNRLQQIKQEQKRVSDHKGKLLRRLKALGGDEP